jgi:hypothetical protein
VNTVRAPNEVRIFCADPDRIIGEIDQVMPLLSPDVRRRLNAIKMHYLAAYGLKGAYERLNDRTVSQILDEHNEESVHKVAQGTRDGVRFTLFAPPPLVQEPAKQEDERELE